MSRFSLAAGGCGGQLGLVARLLIMSSVLCAAATGPDKTATCPTTSDYSAVVLKDNPILYWPMNEVLYGAANGRSVPAPYFVNLGTIGRSYDAVFTHLGGIIADVPSLLPSGGGKSIRWNCSHGTPSGDCGSAVVPGFAKVSSASTFSVEFWVRFHRAYNAGSPDCCFAVLSDYLGAGKWCASVGIGSEGLRVHKFSTAYPWSGFLDFIQAGVVAHVVITFYNNRLRIFVNGTQRATQLTQTSSCGSNNIFPLRFGSSSSDPTAEMTLDEVAWYHFPLDPVRIQAHFDAGMRWTPHYSAAVLADDPAAYWPLNEGSLSTSGALLHDATPNGHHAIVDGTQGLASKPSLLASGEGNSMSVVCAPSDLNCARAVVPSGFEKVGTDGFTVEFWLRLGESTNSSLGVSLLSDVNYIANTKKLCMSLGVIHDVLRVRKGQQYEEDWTGFPSLYANTTIHFVYRFSKAIEKVELFVNGQKKFSMAAGNTDCGAEGTLPLAFGRNMRNTTGSASMELDEIAWYRHLLSDEKILQHYQIGANVRTAHEMSSDSNYTQQVLSDGPTAYWMLDDGLFASGCDVSGNHQHGTVRLRPASAGKTMDLTAANLLPSKSLTPSAHAVGFQLCPPGTSDCSSVMLPHGIDPLGDTGFSIEFWLKPHGPFVVSSTTSGTYTTLLQNGFGTKHIVNIHMVHRSVPEYGLSASRLGLPVLHWQGVIWTVDAANAHHVVMTVDLVNRTSVLYVNGTKFVEEAITNTTPLVRYNPGPLFIGASDDYASVLGDVDEVAMFDYPLPRHRVSAHFACALVPWEDDDYTESNYTAAVLSDGPAGFWSMSTAAVSHLPSNSSLIVNLTPNKYAATIVSSTNLTFVTLPAGTTTSPADDLRTPSEGWLEWNCFNQSSSSCGYAVVYANVVKYGSVGNSLEFWIIVKNTPGELNAGGYRTILSDRSLSSASPTSLDHLFSVAVGPTGLRYSVRLSSGEANLDWPSLQSFVPHHVVVTQTKVGKAVTIRMYINGTLWNALDRPDLDLSHSNHPIVFGPSPGGSGAKVILGAVAWYTQVLSQEKIFRHFMARRGLENACGDNFPNITTPITTPHPTAVSVPNSTNNVSVPTKSSTQTTARTPTPSASAVMTPLPSAAPVPTPRPIGTSVTLPRSSSATFSSSLVPAPPPPPTAGQASSSETASMEEDTEDTAPPAASAVVGAVADVLGSSTAAEAVVGTGAGSTVVAAVVNPIAAGQAVRLGAVAGAIQCSFSDDDTVPSVFELPLQMKLGEGQMATFAGSTLLTTLAFICLPWATTLLFWVYWRSEMRGSGEGDKFKRVKTLQAKIFSNISAVALGYIGPVVLKSLVLVLRHEPSVTQAVVVIACGLVAVASMWVVVWGIFFGSKDGMELLPPAGTTAQVETATPKYTLQSKAPLFVETFGIFCDASRDFSRPIIRGYFVVEVLATSLMMMIDGIRPASYCEGISGAMMVVSGALLLYLVVFRPFRSKLEMAFVTLTSVLLCALSIIAFAVTIIGEVETPTRASLIKAFGYIAVSENGIFFAQALVLAFWAYVTSQRRMVYERQAKASPSTTTNQLVIGTSEMSSPAVADEGNDMDVELSNPLLAVPAPTADSSRPLLSI